LGLVRIKSIHSIFCIFYLFLLLLLLLLSHGLPVEFEIDKKLGIKGPADVLKMGIDVYNAECRSIVMRYSHEWETIVSRLGRWIDFEKDYKTLYPWFMESVWWVFKQIFNKGLVYRGFKVMPYSTSCCTPLSNFEAGQNYKEIQGIKMRR
jgi:isoleucyl-tRNA synthetase